MFRHCGIALLRSSNEQKYSETYYCFCFGSEETVPISLSNLPCVRVHTRIGFPGGSDSKESTCNARDLGLIPGSGGSLGEGHGSPFQYSHLENPRDRGAWWATVHGITKSWKQLSDLTHKFQSIWLSQDFFLSFQSEYSSLIIRIYHFSSWSSGMK